MALKSDVITLPEIVSKINNYFSNHPMEKVFLHLDKPHYAKGDRIWFKIYNLNYSTNQLSSLSEVLYVTITNEKDELIETIKVPLYDGVGDGYYDIPLNIYDQTLQISGFTNWMKNFDESLYFKKLISIDGSELVQKTSSNDFNLTLFPEGGQMLNKKITKIAFTTDVLDETTGYVIKNKTDTISQINSDKSGYGFFNFLPIENDKYEVVFNYHGNIYHKELPSPNISGTTLRILDKGISGLQVVADCSTNLNGTKSYILIQNNGKVLYSIDTQFEHNAIIAEVKKELLPEGLISFTQLNEEGRLLNQRLWYNQKENNNIGPIEVNTSKNIHTREIASVNIVSNIQDVIHASISIIPNKYFSPEISKNANQYGGVLSGTDIKDKSSSFLEGINEKLIAHKIKAYSWENIQSQESIEFKYPMEKRSVFNISGKVDNAQLINEGDVYGVTLSGKDHDFYFDTFNEGGYFDFSIPSFSGRKNLIIKAYKVDENKFSLNYDIEDYIPTSIIKTLNQKEEQNATIYSVNTKENLLIDRVYQINRNEKIESTIQNENITYSILSVPQKTIKLEDFIPLKNMEEISKELLEGVSIRVKSDGNAEIRMKSIDEKTGNFMSFYKEQPLLFIDGALINNPNIVAELSPLDVESIDINYGQYNLNGVNFKGVLAIHTSEGNYARVNTQNHGYFEIDGFQYKMRYTAPLTNSNIPDFRTLLSWEPNIKIEAGKVTNIKFMTSDEEGFYTININGLTTDGSQVFEQLTFEVTDKNR